MSKQSVSVTVDAVVFGYQSAPKISVLLIRRKNDPFKGYWAIPGGFVEDDEALEDAVLRELEEETGVEITYLEQLYTFGRPDRDSRGRTISVAYFGLLRQESHIISANTDAEEVAWFDVENLPKLAFDHQEIFNTALTRLRAKITYEPIGFELLDEKFPFSDLENLYTTLLGRAIDRRNFRKKIMSFGLLEELNEKTSRGPGRPANLFRFNKDRYFQLKQDGILFEI